MNFHTVSGHGTNPFEDMHEQDAIWQRLLDVTAERFGFTSVLYAFTHSRFTASRTGLTNSVFLIHKHDEDYLACFPDGLSLDDAIAAQLILNGETDFLWQDFDKLDLRPSQRASLEFDKSLGMGVGVSFGFRFGGHSGFGGTCWGKRHEDPDRFRAMWQARRGEMVRLAHQFDAAMRPVMVRNRFKLTPREVDVMSYSAGGMTAKQIADHLGLSPKTINHTLERTRKKMEAVSTMEAVAKALIYDLIG